MSNEEKLKEAIWKKTEAEFPFTEVSRYMATENWTWYSRSPEKHVPTPQELSDRAKDLLMNHVSINPHFASAGTGGFYWDKRGDELELIFGRRRARTFSLKINLSELIEQLRIEKENV